MGQPVLSSANVLRRGIVSVVLVTWNSAPYLRRCLEGITHQTYRGIEVIAVDNASADESAALVAPHATRLIRNDTNRGFSAAVNQALAVASGEYLLLVNPDCHLMPEYVERLVRVFEPRAQGAGRRAQDPDPRAQGAGRRAQEPDPRGQSAGRRAQEPDVTGPLPPAPCPLPPDTPPDTPPASIGSATGMLIRARGHEIEPAAEIDSMGIRMTRTGRHFDLYQGSPANRQPPTANPFEVFGVSGAAGMFRMSFLQDVSIDGETFDEDFFAYREDADIAWRGRLFGWGAVCEPLAVAYHVRRVTPEVRGALPASLNMHSVKNRFLLRLKNEGAYLALRNAPFELARDLVVFIAALTVERTSLPAFRWLWRNRARVLAKRRAIQARRKVSDRELARWFT